MARGEEESARKFVNWPEAHRRRKAAQVASGKSIVDIAEVIGVTDGYLGLFIRTREIGAMDILLGLAQELNTTTDYLLAAPNVWFRRHVRVWVKPGSRYAERIGLVELV